MFGSVVSYRRDIAEPGGTGELGTHLNCHYVFIMNVSIIDLVIAACKLKSCAVDTTTVRHILHSLLNVLYRARGAHPMISVHLARLIPRLASCCYQPASSSVGMTV